MLEDGWLHGEGGYRSVIHLHLSRSLQCCRSTIFFTNRWRLRGGAHHKGSKPGEPKTCSLLAAAQLTRLASTVASGQSSGASRDATVGGGVSSGRAGTVRMQRTLPQLLLLQVLSHYQQQAPGLTEEFREGCIRLHRHPELGSDSQLRSPNQASDPRLPRRHDSAEASRGCSYWCARVLTIFFFFVAP